MIAGQGTAGREIAEDMIRLGVTPDIVVAPASGGGLIAGVATAIKGRYPDVMMIVAEPESFDDHSRSLRLGAREAHHAAGRTICDALMASIPGEITFAINCKLLSHGVTASDAEVATGKEGFPSRSFAMASSSRRRCPTDTTPSSLRSAPVRFRSNTSLMSCSRNTFS